METALLTPRRAILLLALLIAALIAQPVPPAEAATFTGCNGDVCTSVTYSGRTVTEWKSQGYNGSGFTCNTARFWVDGALYDTEYACDYSWINAFGPSPRTWSSGTELCTSWSGVSGLACMTI